MGNEVKRFIADRAWVQGRWARDVLLSVDGAGRWCEVRTGATGAQSAGATALAGPVLPGLVNAHSHAFQRAIAGLTERRSSAGGDDFWSWRDRMYRAAARITPEQLETIASLLYAELLRGGYTQVCEFHYLHNGADDKVQADPLEMSLALVRAARKVGMGLTLLPTLYMRSGFGAAGLRDDQRRCTSTPDSLVRLIEGVQRQTRASDRVNVGVALHSLRAVDAAAVNVMADFAAQRGLPVHIHIAEQQQEVQDCIAHTGQRPIAWLLDHVAVNGQWNLVHATQTSAGELSAVSQSGAAIVICPSTEANLGDGVFDYSGYAAASGHWSIGSDSHVTRSWSEELRLLEYSQRLTQRRRNVAAQGSENESSAATLFEVALAGGRGATGLDLGAISVGQRADFLVLDGQSPALLGIPEDHLLDALVFSSPDARFKEVFVAGEQVAAVGPQGCADALWAQLQQDFVRTMKTLW